MWPHSWVCACALPTQRCRTPHTRSRCATLETTFAFSSTSCFWVFCGPMRWTTPRTALVLCGAVAWSAAAPTGTPTVVDPAGGDGVESVVTFTLTVSEYPRQPRSTQRRQAKADGPSSEPSESSPSAEPDVPSKTLIAALQKCGARGLATEMLRLDHEGKEVKVTAVVPKDSWVKGDDIARAVGSDSRCFTPELQRELSKFVVISSAPVVSYEIVPAPSPPPPLPPPTVGRSRLHRRHRRRPRLPPFPPPLPPPRPKNRPPAPPPPPSPPPAPPPPHRHRPNRLRHRRPLRHLRHLHRCHRRRPPRRRRLHRHPTRLHRRHPTRRRHLAAAAAAALAAALAAQPAQPAVGPVPGRAGPRGGGAPRAFGAAQLGARGVPLRDARGGDTPLPPLLLPPARRLRHLRHAPHLPPRRRRLPPPLSPLPHVLRRLRRLAPGAAEAARRRARALRAACG